MKQTPGKRSLEGLTVFPYVAWLLVGSFAWFVYTLNAQVITLTEELEQAQLEKNALQSESDIISGQHETNQPS